MNKFLPKDYHEKIHLWQHASIAHNINCVQEQISLIEEKMERYKFPKKIIDDLNIAWHQVCNVSKELMKSFIENEVEDHLETKQVIALLYEPFLYTRGNQLDDPDWEVEYSYELRIKEIEKSIQQNQKELEKIRNTGEDDLYKGDIKFYEYGIALGKEEIEMNLAIIRSIKNKAKITREFNL